ncbi:aldehyde ferredoxin oxidoreductase family protein [Chloroflexota bacterium]
MKADKISGGLAGKILRVDLSDLKVRVEDTEKYAQRFIGGRTINSYILLSEMSRQTRWPDPENMLIFGAGPLVGTMAPASCRVSVDTKSVFNNGKGSANFGGHFGPELKYAGFDHVVIVGKAKKPVYLWICDGKAEIREAAYIWGKTTYETEDMLRQELGDSKVEVASIGPAGENLVRGSCIFTNPGKAAGGSGVGCVMGSKKLKAIAVRGRRAIKVAEPKRFMVAVDKAMAKIEASPHSKDWRKGIIEAKFLPDSPMWDAAVVSRNGQDEYWPPSKRQRLVGLESGIPSYKKRMMSCFACPIGCMPFYDIKEGKYAGTCGIGYWINSANYSAWLDLDDPEASLRYHIMMNKLGLDGDMCSVTLAWAFESYEKGLITKEDTGGLELRWGDPEIILKMQEMLAYRQGIGDLLAEGVQEAARRLAKGSNAFAIHMKGQDSVEAYRARRGWGFGISVSPVAGRHLRGAVSTPEMSGPKDLKWSPFEYENIPEAVFWQAQTKEIEDMTGLCIYVGTWGGAHALEVGDYAELISSAMGSAISEDELMILARRGINLEKAFNTIHTDFDRRDDYPPKRYMEEPIKLGPYAGQKCDKNKWDEMLDKYYELQGWDKETGMQTSETLRELGLEDILMKLKEADKLK